MATWQEVQSYAKEKYPKSYKGSEKSFGITFAYASEQRKQTVMIRTFKAFEADWLEIWSSCCKVDEMSPKVALTDNGKRSLGWLAIDGEKYIYRYTVPLDTLDLQHFDHAVKTVGDTADIIEEKFSASDVF